MFSSESNLIRICLEAVQLAFLSPLLNFPVVTQDLTFSKAANGLGPGILNLYLKRQKVMVQMHLIVCYPHLGNSPWLSN